MLLDRDGRLAHLPELADDELHRELRDAKAALEERLRRRCRFLAYPFGDHDERVRRAAERAGYEAAFAVKGSRGDRFALPRVALPTSLALGYVSAPDVQGQGLLTASIEVENTALTYEQGEKPHATPTPFPGPTL